MIRCRTRVNSTIQRDARCAPEVGLGACPGPEWPPKRDAPAESNVRLPLLASAAPREFREPLLVMIHVETSDGGPSRSHRSGVYGTSVKARTSMSELFGRVIDFTVRVLSSVKAYP